MYLKVSLSDDLYKELILDHSQNPSYREPLSDVSVRESGVNRSCGDEVELELFIKDKTICGICVSGQGCAICMASGSMMAESVHGMTTHEASSLVEIFKAMILRKEKVIFPEELEDLQAMQGVRKYPIRVKCATLPWNTLEQALKNSEHL